MPSEAEFMRLARLECIFGATVKYQPLSATQDDSLVLDAMIGEAYPIVKTKKSQN